jgi:hypothetical protein
MKKFLITHWVTADFIAQKVVDESQIDATKNDLKTNTVPDGTFSIVMLKGTEKKIRTTYEEYNETLNENHKE